MLIENFKVGNLAKYGLDYDSLKEINPRLIYCSVTGFGQTGPDAALPGYDGLFQATGGIMAVTGIPEGRPGAGPLKCGPSLVDFRNRSQRCNRHPRRAAIPRAHRRGSVHRHCPA